MGQDIPTPSLRWIEAIHARLTLAYGTRFGEQYGNLSRDALLKSWAHELKFVSSAAIAHALAHLPPDHPPNVLQFKALCATLPKLPPSLMLPGRGGTKPTEADLRKLAEALKRITTSDRSARAWAYKLRDREAAGERLTEYQKNAWRQALPATAVSTSIQKPSIGAGCSDAQASTL